MHRDIFFLSRCIASLMAFPLLEFLWLTMDLNYILVKANLNILE
jgi:hypothetical protein